MANRPKVPPKLKQKLIEEAGNKCANPGCANYRTHIHHIQEWSVYKTHDGDHMIAICPSCHDEVHYGRLKIDDKTVYEWKGIKRKSTNRDQLFIEPDYESKLFLGSIAVTGQQGVTAFELTKSNKLSYKLIDEDIFLMNLNICNLKGEEIIKVIQNHVKYKEDESIKFERRPGRFKVTTTRPLDFIPLWAIKKMLEMERPYKIENGILTIIDLEVVAPGEVRAQGIWAEFDRIILITDTSLNFIVPGGHPLTLVTEGEGTSGYATLEWHGKIDSSMFGFK
ncbi:HNH endonuclease signature motif containing protein [Priestia megaterium]|jgi:HNH endonuclease|uniref:HNH endonuclease signature motif containing protein n=1 Tax=Priestia megaterium TaxID=1404 RepID=UPI0021BE00DD|nr:HNH endonuclease signature motif containing protein [Priestia megaterium]MCT9852858.1 HNH endonuclease [Priestia megaterium]MDF1962482.1 HNH endonuclease signature motif containing protein [Priestia megaterium]